MDTPSGRMWWGPPHQAVAHMRPETCPVAENTSQSNEDPWHTPQCSHWPAGSWPTCPPEPQSCVSSVLTWLRRTMDLEGFGLGSDNVGPILRPPQPPESTAWFLATAPSSEPQKRIRSPTFASYRLFQLCVGWEAVCLTSLMDGWGRGTRDHPPSHGLCRTALRSIHSWSGPLHGCLKIGSLTQGFEPSVKVHL